MREVARGETMFEEIARTVRGAAALLFGVAADKSLLPLLLLLLPPLVAADRDLLQRTAPALDKFADAFARGAAASQEDFTQHTDTWDLVSSAREQVRRALAEMLARTADHVRCAEGAAAALHEQVKESKEKFGNEVNGISDEMFVKVRAKAKEALRKILDILGQGKRNLDDSMDRMARLRFGDVVELIREKLAGAYGHPIGDARSNADFPQLLKKLLVGDQLQNGQSEEEERGRQFVEWVLGGVWQLEGLRNEYGGIRAAATESISRSKDESAEMSREALDYFRPRREELGPLWGRLLEATREAVGKF